MKRLFTLLVSAILTLGVATVCLQAVDTTLTPTAHQKASVKKAGKARHHHRVKKTAAQTPAQVSSPAEK